MSLALRFIFTIVGLALIYRMCPPNMVSPLRAIIMTAVLIIMAYGIAWVVVKIWRE